MDERECRRTTLATSKVGRVELCSCGTAHLSIGSVTLRLPAAAIPAVRELLDDALAAGPEHVAGGDSPASMPRRRPLH